MTEQPSLFQAEAPAARYAPGSAQPVRPAPARRCNVAQYVRERFNLPAEWTQTVWKVVEIGGRPMGQSVRGAVYPHRFTKGPKKGRPDTKRPEPGTELEWTVSDDEFDAWCLRWEAEERRCRHCEGTGIVFAGWSRYAGTTMRVCKKCDGTGNPPAGQSAA